MVGAIGLVFGGAAVTQMGRVGMCLLRPVGLLGNFGNVILEAGAIFPGNKGNRKDQKQVGLMKRRNKEEDVAYC